MGVLSAGVCLKSMSGATARTPRLGIRILGTGVGQVHGQWGPIAPAVRPTLGSAIFVSRQPRNRVGFGSAARDHARCELERNVHRIGRSFVAWGGIYGASRSGPPRESGLFGEAHRARAWHGRLCKTLRRTARTAVSRSSGFSLQHRFLSSPYTILAAPREVSGSLGRQA